VRSYDLVIRVSGDGCVCVLCGGTIADARTRFGAVRQTLTRKGITTAIGYAELAADDTPSTLVDRASADLVRTRATTAAPSSTLTTTPST
jgi:hypothetical protein